MFIQTPISLEAEFEEIIHLIPPENNLDFKINNLKIIEL
jgi:hypothetical protein